MQSHTYNLELRKLIIKFIRNNEKARMFRKIQKIQKRGKG